MGDQIYLDICGKTTKMVKGFMMDINIYLNVTGKKTIVHNPINKYFQIFSNGFSMK